MSTIHVCVDFGTGRSTTREGACLEMMPNLLQTRAALV